MNVQFSTAIVTSKDGVQFAVHTDRSAVPYERAFAAKFTADQLDKHGDYQRVETLDVLLAPEEIFPRIASPAERRAAFRVIKGGKS